MYNKSFFDEDYDYLNLTNKPPYKDLEGNYHDDEKSLAEANKKYIKKISKKRNNNNE